MEYVMRFRDFMLGLVIMFWAFLAPIQVFIYLCGSMVLIDLVTGIWKAVKEKQKITSFKLRQTITKSLAYFLCIILAFILDNVLGSGLMASRTVGGLIAVTESKSCFENLHVITGIDVWSAILAKLQPPKE